MTRKIWIGGNWKCNGDLTSVDSLTRDLRQFDFDDEKMGVVIFPPSIHVDFVKKNLPPKFKIALQNCSRFKNGAYTGEISAEMIKNYGIEWVLIGHSERRIHFNETNEIILEKFTRAKEADLNIVLCIGETLSQRESGQTNEILKCQLNHILPHLKDVNRLVIAYEPVWAIGTSVNATPLQAQTAHKYIRSLIEEKLGRSVSESIRIVYGGSVKDDNCESLIKENDVDGFLIGGASLSSTSFKNIIHKSIKS